jgi:uncharacterized protein (TIGR02270 family)
VAKNVWVRLVRVRNGDNLAINGIISQFAEEAAFLWSLRARTVDAPHISLEDLAKLDERIEAHIDGLRVAGEAGWDTCEKSLESEVSGAYFAPSILSLESGITTRIQAVLDAIGKNQAKAHSFISALGWISYEQVKPHINNLLVSESSFHRYIGVAASALHRRDPGPSLDEAVIDNDPLLRARALRAVGELGGHKNILIRKLWDNFTDDDAGLRFSAAWSAALLGDTGAVDVLKCLVNPTSRYREKALNMALRRMEPAKALAWQKELAYESKTIRPAIIGAGIIGDAVLMSWLVKQMQVPALARIAGEAFSMITGADIERENLKGRWPEGFEAGPDDNPGNINVEMDPDVDLSWPDPESIMRWWDNYKGAFKSGTRHLLGKPVTADHLRHVLNTGRQRQRAAAALELAILQPGRPLFEVRAPGFRQIQVISLKTEG